MVCVIYYEHLCDFPKSIILDTGQELITLSYILKLLNINERTNIYCLTPDNQLGYVWQNNCNPCESLPMCDGRIILKFDCAILEQTFKSNNNNGNTTVDDLLDFNFDDVQNNFGNIHDVFSNNLCTSIDKNVNDVVDKKELEEKVLKWSTKNNKLLDVRNLLSNLENVLWSDERWTKVYLVDILDEARLKITYRKALQIVYPDKCIDENKYMGQLIFDKLSQAREIFNDTNEKKI